MKIFTYFDTSYLSTHQGGILRLWRDSWARWGWEPRALNPRTFARFPRRKEFLAKAKGSGSFLNTDYYRIVRWQALADVGGGWYCDYDVINFGLRESCWTERATLRSRTFSDDHALVYVTHKDATRIVNLFLDTDKFLSAPELVEAAGILKAYYKSKHCDLGDTGWESSATVHFSSQAVKKYVGFHVPKHKAVESCGRSVYAS